MFHIVYRGTAIVSWWVNSTGYEFMKCSSLTGTPGRHVTAVSAMQVQCGALVRRAQALAVN